MERPESFIVPARRSQWLVSAMAYAFGLDQGIENEIVVLATGIDQYIQEIFHNLDVLGKDRVSLEDFRILCEVIGFRDCRGTSPTDDTVPDSDENPPTELTFKEFHSRLLQCFIEDDGSDCRSQDVQTKMIRRWDSSGKFVEAEVRVLPRSGVSIRTMCTECFQKRPVTEIYHSIMFKQGKFHCVESNTVDTDTTKQNDPRLAEFDKSLSVPGTSTCLCSNKIADIHDEIAKLQQESDGLREIVEDMRQALQSSDARHLALLVALRKLEIRASGNSASNQPTFPPLPPKLPGHSSIRPQNAVTLTRELSRLRDDRDRQLEEAICYTQSLEADLWRSRRDQNRMNQTRSVLLNNQQSLAQRLCSARETLSGGLDRVRELGKQMEDAEKLQSDLQQFTTEWKHRKCEGDVTEDVVEEARRTSETSGVVSTESPGRSLKDSEIQTVSPKSSLEGSQKSSDASRGSSDASGGSSEDLGGSSEDSAGDHMTGMDSGCASDSDRGSPLSAGSEADSSSLGSGSVSDEESAWQEETNNNNINNNNTNSNNNNNNNHSNSCANSALTGGLNDADWLIKLTQVQKHLLKTEVEKGQAEGKFKQIRADLLQELNAKLKENEEYQSEIQKLESERVRLSVIESTVGEVITLLRRLRNLNLSRRSAGKILMDTLEVCLQDNYNSDSENEVRNFLNFFHKQLMHHDLLRLSGAGIRGTQSTPCSPVMRRATTPAAATDASPASASAARATQLNTDFYQFHDGSAAKKLCRGRGAAAATNTANEEDDDAMMNNGNSPTLDVSA